MFRCSECGEEFETPVVRAGENLCPKCRSWDIQRIDDSLEECECCHRKVVSTDKHGICSSCSARLSDLWEYFVFDAMLITHEPFTQTEAFIKDYLKAIWRDEE